MDTEQHWIELRDAFEELVEPTTELVRFISDLPAPIRSRGEALLQDWRPLMRKAVDLAYDETYLGLVVPAAPEFEDLDPASPGGEYVDDEGFTKNEDGDIVF
jgi:hypothetical protein